MSVRILVLSSSTGSGHDMRARAFEEWVRRIFPGQAEVHIEQVIENGSLLGRFGVWIYNTIQKHAPFLHNIYFFIVELFVSSHARSVTFGGGYYRRLLASLRPDVVLSVHDSTNRGYFEDAHKVLGKGVRCVTYCGEFSGGYGYSRNWVNPVADAFIARTHAAREHAVSLGMPRERTSVFHKFLPPEAFAPRLDDRQRSQLLRELGFAADRFTLFLATGGYGANHHLAFLRAILPLAGKVQVIVVCGRNLRVQKRVRSWSRRHAQMALHVEGFSNRMADYLQLADAVVTRGGANTTMEALHFDCPLLYNALGGLMPQEHCTVRYFLDKGAARLLKRPGDLLPILANWIPRGPEFQSVRSRLADLHVDEDPHDLIHAILGPAAPGQPPAGTLPGS